MLANQRVAFEKVHAVLDVPSPLTRYSVFLFRAFWTTDQSFHHVAREAAGARARAGKTKFREERRGGAGQKAAMEPLGAFHAEVRCGVRGCSC